MGTSSGASYRQEQEEMPPVRHPAEVCRVKKEMAEAVHHIKKEIMETEEEGVFEQRAVVRRFGTADRLGIRDVAGDPIDVVANRMRDEPEEFREELKGELRVILEGIGCAQHRDQFGLLQKLVQNRMDLTPGSLMRAHRTQLEILVAIKTGMQAFLHPDIRITQMVLMEIFFHKRCRNIACQNQLPADGCACEFCGRKNGFCNLCMCLFCGKFDFDANTCRWIGCDACSHWTHTDCAVRVGQISMGFRLENGGGSPEMLFKCMACKRTSELLGWVKDVFQHCALDWGRGALMKEFDCIRRIFRGSEDLKGLQLYWKSEELLDKLKNGVDEASLCKEMKHFFQELETKDANNDEREEGKILEPKEACNRIAQVVQEAVEGMEAVAEEKARVLKKARLASEMCDREFEDKRRELAELQFERKQKKQQIEELEAIVRLKQAEADMFQQKADEARRESEGLQQIALAKSEKVEEEYASRYLKLRLNEAEAERRLLFNKIQLQEHLHVHPDPSEMLMLSRIQGVLKSVYNVPKTDSQS